MARTAVTVTDLTGATSVANPAGTTADATNGHVITGTRPEVLLLRVNNTAGGAKNVIVKAGAFPIAESSGQGDLTVSVPATTGSVLVGPLESARFLQNDGTLNVDLEAGFTGTVAALKVNRR